MAHGAGAAGQADAAGRNVGDGRVTYRERLYVAWWAWPLPLVGAVLIAAEVHMGYPGVRAWLPYVVAVALVLTLLVTLGLVQVRVGASDPDGEPELHAGDAHLPLRFIRDVDVIDKPDKRKALGPQLDPAAFVLHRAWVGRLVRVYLADQDDPTPYWLLSTRRPRELARALGFEPAATSDPDPDPDPDEEGPDTA